MMTIRATFSSTTMRAAVIGLLIVTASCGSGSDDAADDTGDSSPSSTDTTTDSPTTAAPPSTPGSSSTTPGDAELEQPAIWPAASVAFATPEEAAADFVTKVLLVPAVLGTFRQGDSRSGEIEVLMRGEGGIDRRIFRSLLLLRQLGSDNGWFVLAAVNENASITLPESGSEVSAGSVDIKGVARGYEATVTVAAYLAGSDEPIDQVLTSGGSLDDPEPFSVSLDLSGTEEGDVVAIVVRGDTGLETDPGDFGAISLVIG